MAKRLLDYALEYHRLGWSIIPIIIYKPPGAKKSKKVPPKGFKWKCYQKKRPEESDIRKWFGNGVYENLAVVCGAVSGGLTVLDLDSRERWEWWRREHADLSYLPTVMTEFGTHIYFRSKSFPKQNGDDVDLLCEGAYVALPPSKNKEWTVPLNGELPLLDPFQWGLELFGIHKRQHFTEEREEREDTEEIEASGGGEGDSSVSSVSSVKQEGKVVKMEYTSLSKEPKKAVDEAINQTLPTKTTQRNRSIFQFCRWLKGMNEFAELPARALKSIIKEWHRKGRELGVIGTVPFDETYADFCYGWDRVKWPKGNPTLGQAVDKALAAKVPLDIEKEYDSPETRLLLKVCYEMQKLRDPNPFWLSCRDAGGIVGLSHSEANARLLMLVTDGVLEIVQENTNTKARRFRFVNK